MFNCTIILSEVEGAEVSEFVHAVIKLAVVKERCHLLERYCFCGVDQACVEGINVEDWQPHEYISFVGRKLIQIEDNNLRNFS